MPIGHSPRAPTNVFRPEPVAFCDRCSFKYPLAKLQEQRIWAGDMTAGTGLLVCPVCLDELQENGFRTIVIGPDPAPLKNPRPGNLPKQTPAPQFVLDDEIINDGG